ncbi:DUF397 domain-containing protein [Candidatus Sororendozoicomonas aggregata]|uniref:DUF397 domain-containing protein n=1 Tax=Candidatus Sororendozoicomonas aggregata TaxID=3073239 RepID=UPI002ED1AADC
MKNREFIKSSFSSPMDDLCVEVAKDDNRILVRDSKDPSCKPLSFTEREWLAFIKGAKNNEFDF